MAAFIFLLMLQASVLFINCELVLNDVAGRERLWKGDYVRGLDGPDHGGGNEGRDCVVSIVLCVLSVIPGGKGEGGKDERKLHD
jgi:hypothetical protein